MMQGKFQSQEKQKTIDQSKKIISVWEKNASPSLPDMASLGWKDIHSFDFSTLENRLQQASILSIVVGDNKQSKRFVQELFKILSSQQTQARIYLYAEQKLENFIRKIQEASSLDILVRLGPKPPADWIVFNQGHTAFLIFGQTETERSWGLFTQQEIAMSLFQSFYLLFWFTATQEAFGSQNGTLDFGAPLKAPFAPPSSLKSNMLHSGELRLMNQFNPIQQAEILVSPELSSSLSARRIISPPLINWNSNHPTPIPTTIPKQLAQAGSELVWFPHQLPQMSISYERFLLDLNGEAISLRLEWGKAQAIQLHHCLASSCSNPEWKFYPVRQLGKIQGDILISNSTKPQEIKKHQEISLDKVKVPLALPYNPPTIQLPTASLLTPTIIYKWIEEPESLPTKASKDPLYGKWRKIDEWARTQLNNIDSALRNLEKKCSRFPDKTDDLEYYNEEKIELGDIAPSKNYQDVGEQIKRIERLGFDVEKLAKEIHQLELEQEKLEAQKDNERSWEERLQARNWSNPKQKEAISKTLLRYRTLETTIKEKQAELESSENQGLFSKKSSVKDLKQIQTEIRQAEKEINRLQKELEKKLAPQKPILTLYQATFRPMKSPNLPKEQLPNVGELYFWQGKRYLAVLDWQKVSNAQKEIQRLNAILVAKEIAKGTLVQEVW